VSGKVICGRKVSRQEIREKKRSNLRGIELEERRVFMRADAELLSLQDQGSVRKQKKNTSIGKGTAFVFLFLLIWGGLVYGGYYYTKQYFDQTITNLQQTNALHMQEVNEKLSALNNELNALQDALSNTDETLSSAGDIQEELNEKIELLDEQLKALEKSLNILKEAP